MHITVSVKAILHETNTHYISGEKREVMKRLQALGMASIFFNKLELIFCLIQSKLSLIQSNLCLAQPLNLSNENSI